MIWYNIIHLTAIGLTPGGNSAHLHTNNTCNNSIDIEQHNSLIRKSADRAPSLRVIPWHLPTSEEKARKTLSQGSRRVPVGTMKTEYTEQNIHNNKNT